MYIHENENYGCYISSALSTNLKISKLSTWQKIEMGNKQPEMMENINKHIFVVGALGAGKSTAMSVLFNPTKAATE